MRAGQLMKIEVLDHVILGNPGHASLREMSCPPLRGAFMELDEIGHW
jgi:hypothetical protein